MVPRLNTVDEPFSFKSLISVTLSSSGEQRTVAMGCRPLLKNMSALFLLPLWEKVAWTKPTPDEGSFSIR